MSERSPVRVPDRRPAAQPELPPSMALAWGVAPEPSRGPKRGLSLPRIVDAGIRVAAEHGIDAVAMSKVAAELGASTMGLYRYVPSKDALLELMVDSALGPPPDGFDGADWRAELRTWAESVRAAYQTHPWALRVPISGPPLGPNNLRWLEAALTALRATPLTAQERISSVLLLSGFVRNVEIMRLDIRAGEERGGIDAMQWGQLAARLVDEHRFPELCRILTADVLEDEDDDEYEFEFGLVRVLDGLEALIRSRRRRR